MHLFHIMLGIKHDEKVWRSCLKLDKLIELYGFYTYYRCIRMGEVDAVGQLQASSCAGYICLCIHMCSNFGLSSPFLLSTMNS